MFSYSVKCPSCHQSVVIPMTMTNSFGDWGVAGTGTAVSCPHCGHVFTPSEKELWTMYYTSWVRYAGVFIAIVLGTLFLFWFTI